MVPILIRFVLLAALIGAAIYLVRKWVGSGAPAFKCRTCRHCGQLDDEGVVCRFGNRHTFKNPVHIQNCIDYAADPRR